MFNSTVIYRQRFIRRHPYWDYSFLLINGPHWKRLFLQSLVAFQTVQRTEGNWCQCQQPTIRAGIHTVGCLINDELTKDMMKLALWQKLPPSYWLILCNSTINKYSKVYAGTPQNFLVRNWKSSLKEGKKETVLSRKNFRGNQDWQISAQVQSQYTLVSVYFELRPPLLFIWDPPECNSVVGLSHWPRVPFSKYWTFPIFTKISSRQKKVQYSGLCGCTYVQ